MDQSADYSIIVVVNLITLAENFYIKQQTFISILNVQLNWIRFWIDLQKSSS